MVDLLIGDVPAPSPSGDWKTSIRAQATSARRVIAGHRWAPQLITSRNVITPAMLDYLEGVTGIFRRAGFSNELSHHAMHTLGARLFGLSQEPFNEGRLTPELMRTFVGHIQAGNYPAIAASLAGIRHNDDAEFEFGLDLILRGLDQVRAPA